MLQRSLPRRSFSVVATYLLTFLVATSAFAVNEKFSQTYDLVADGRISLENVNGDVVIEGWDGDDVQVSYIKEADSQEALDRMEVEIDVNGSGVSISTEYKKSRESDGWRSSGSVDFTLQVPRGARIDSVELVNGNLELRQLSGEVSAEIVNGNVEATGMAGRLGIESVNGQTNVAFDQLTAGQRIELSSVNGSLTVTLPDDADAVISAETVHGGIENDFGLTVDKGRYVGSNLRGTLGSGGARVELENVNGSIRVRRH